MGDKLHQLHHFLKNVQIFCIKLLYNNWPSKLNYVRKAGEKKEWAGLKNLICIILNVCNYSLGLNFLMGFLAICFSRKYLLIRDTSGESEETVQ